MSPRRSIPLLATLALALLSLPAAGVAAPQPGDFREDDFGGFRAVLPPGTNGFANGPQLIQFQIDGTRPPHNSDQLPLYRDLLFEYPQLTAKKLPGYFKDASFGARAADRERTYSPRADVTVVRDEWGVPKVYGATRGGAMFGLGYIAAEDRLFFMDALRHAGRAELSELAGGANVEMDESVWGDTPYTEADLERQYRSRPPGIKQKVFRQGQKDALSYVAGINEYILQARLNPSLMPGEYAAIGRPAGPDDWRVTDVIATASLVGGIFGKGGGGELGSAQVLQTARKRFGRRGGYRVWHDFRNAEDPEAPVTARRGRFPYEVRPRHPKGVALPDPGTVRRVQVGSDVDFLPRRIDDGDGLLDGLVGAYRQAGGPAGASNALLVSARESQGGRATAVFGPQVAYFAPQILIEQEVHAPSIDARGAAFPGVNLYVQLGRGRDYAWSATSAGQDNVDTFAVPLCEPGGGRPTMKSDHYRFRGKCRPIEVLEKTISWTPNVADPTPPGFRELHAERTLLGIVVARAKVRGKPVVYTRLRSTYFHEVDSALGFALLNNPKFTKSPRSFQRAAHKINYTFNWFYIDRDHIAYFNSGWNPVRRRGTDPNFPVMSRYAWRHFNPRRVTADYTPFKSRPRVIDQSYLTSWNNKQARGFRSADDNWSYGPTYRSVTLDERVRRLIRGRRKASRVELVKAMEDAATVDLRGHTVLPLALAVIRSRPLASIRNAKLRAAVRRLGAWTRAGAHRIDRNRDGSYEHSQAIRLLDAWWEPLMRAEFEPTLGKRLFDRIEGMNHLDDPPSLGLGSAYNGGWYVYANKDLRTLLGRPVRGRFSRVYCGQGRLGRCRSGLLKSLERVLDRNPYGDNAGCGVGDDQMCFDAIEFRATGGVSQPDIAWQNRPTFQQVVQVKGSR
ncbi:MAG TPA: penicillin acylase family protein [Solirubrobacterales bacterium]|nr:penicillin acylase family protein [Solirubrobacterales bacterium]